MQNGCDAEAPNAVRYFDGQAMTRCARKALPDWVWGVVALYPAWEVGAMPNAGGVLSQPAPLVEALRVVAATLGELAMGRHERDPNARPGPTPDGGARARAPVRFSGRRR